MSDRWLPEVEKERGSFKPETARSLVRRGIEHLEILRLEQQRLRQTIVICAIAERLYSEVREARSAASSLGKTTDLFLTPSQRESLNSLIALCGNAPTRLDPTRLGMLDRLLKEMQKRPKFFWLDVVGVRFAWDMAFRVLIGDGTLSVVANMNHAQSTIRWTAIAWAWLARSALRDSIELFRSSGRLESPADGIMDDLSERILFNFGASHAYRNDGLALLYALHQGWSDFMSRAATTQPDFHNAQRYGPLLHCPRPEQFEHDLRLSIEQLDDSKSELYQYIVEPAELLRFERTTQQRVAEERRSVAVQLEKRWGVAVQLEIGL